MMLTLLNTFILSLDRLDFNKVKRIYQVLVPPKKQTYLSLSCYPKVKRIYQVLVTPKVKRIYH